jgi:hypothetical protein
MAVAVLDYYRIKPEFIPPDLQSLCRYVRPGELSAHADPDQWELVGRTFHPSRLQADTVERRGYCERKLRVGIDVAKLARTLYDRAP